MTRSRYGQDDAKEWISQQLTTIRNYWKFISVVTVIGVASAALAWMLVPKTYTADVELYVSAQTADNAQSAYQGAQLSEQRVKSYVELVENPRILAQVATQLGLTISDQDLADKINASSTSDSVVISVSASDSSPSGASEIANGAAQALIDLVAELERPSNPNAVAPVAVRVVQPASPPELPSSLSLPLALISGLLVGIAIGVVGAILRDALDNTVKTAQQLSDTARVATIGVIPFDPDISRTGSFRPSWTSSKASEAFRQLRTNLLYVDVDAPPRVILVTSPNEGEGKSTSVVNLGIAMASVGSRVLLIEADLRKPKLSEMLGMPSSVGLSTVLAGRASLSSARQIWGDYAIDVLASGPRPPNPSELLSSKQMARLLQTARENYDIVLVDAAPLIPVTDTAALAPATDGVLLVCRSGKTTEADVIRACATLQNVSSPIIGATLSMTASRNSTYGTYGDAIAFQSQPEKTKPWSAAASNGRNANSDKTARIDVRDQEARGERWH